MATHDPAEVLWIAKNRDGGHEALQAPNDPPAGDPRGEKAYSEGVPPRKFSIETAGLMDVITVQFLRDSLLDASGEREETITTRISPGRNGDTCEL